MNFTAGTLCTDLQCSSCGPVGCPAAVAVTVLSTTIRGPPGKYSCVYIVICITWGEKIVFVTALVLCVCYPVAWAATCRLRKICLLSGGGGGGSVTQGVYHG